MNPKVPYNSGLSDALRTCISPERFQSYLDATGGDVEAALRLYVWNTAVSGAFYGPLQACEISLRNAVHDRLSQRYGVRWFENGAFLDPGDVAMAAKAIDRINRLGKTPTPGRVISELGFAYWVGLTANYYDQTIWRTELAFLFHPRPRRKDVYSDLDRLRTLRNRIAHHEPIHNRNLIQDYERVDRVLRLLSPEKTDWVARHSRVYETLALSPEDVVRF